ncbi:DddA-like double-stranded DNA deaminase toxin [Amycolatopsis sp. cg5]|uniref:DddA-like double-stranded DNA deaminase toxin n=1 Tax=Amycolatopsis sp. cg5 TaxID=3238802 RepID=UPI003524AA40
MGDVEAITNAVREAIKTAGVGTRLLEQLAADHGLLGEARDLYSELFAGTELEQLGGHIDEQRQAIIALVDLLDRAQRDLAAYTTRIAGPSAEPQVGALARKSHDRGQPEADTTSARPAPVSTERLDELRAELPPPVDSGKGQKTHGRWIDGEGRAYAVISQADEWKDEVNTILEEEGCPRVPIARASDVELRLAARMRQEGKTDPNMRHVTLLINNVPCDGFFSCESLLSVVLPPGYTLTVHGKNGYVRTFTGGGKPWWR